MTKSIGVSTILKNVNVKFSNDKGIFISIFVIIKTSDIIHVLQTYISSAALVSTNMPAVTSDLPSPFSLTMATATTGCTDMIGSGTG